MDKIGNLLSYLHHTSFYFQNNHFLSQFHNNYLNLLECLIEFFFIKLYLNYFS